MVKFTRKIEDFVCENCKTKVKGNGYTNHCPNCLFSKHVDNYPGDRENPCGGIMKPVSVEYVKGKYYIRHMCEKCGVKAKCKSVEGDSINALVKLSESLVDSVEF
jgi:hypothetical protein